MMETGGWSSRTGELTSTKSMSARFSLAHGINSQSKENGRELHMEVPIQLLQTEMKNARIPTLILTPMISGSTTHNIAFQSPKRPKSLSL